VRLFYVGTARRIAGLALLFFFAIPLGLSVTGCGHKAAAVVYCNAGDSGPVVGQVASITLSPTLATIGESLNYTQIGQGLSASALDCKGSSVSVSRYTYATSNMAIADIDPSTGRVCAGIWNRNTGGNIADFTVCQPYLTPPSTSLAFITATASGAVSNAIPVYVHPVVTGIVLGPESLNCNTDPGTDCSSNTSGPVIAAPVYTGNTGCISQNTTGQLVARVYQNGTTLPADNITLSVGHVSFAAQSSNIVSIDQNGIATANQPGSSLITANISNSSTGSSAGFFSTCPPASITLSIPGQPAGTSSINVGINNLQPLTAVVKDTKGVTLNGLTLEFNSTTPQTIPATTGSVTPLFPGTATITAVCQPSSCNPSPFSQIGLYGNGEPVTSNGITINATGNASTVIYMGSTASQYVLPQDFTTNQPSAFIKLPYVPNSMVITQDGSTIYLGSPQGLMSISTATNTQGNLNQNVPGTVLSVSPDGSTVVVTDPLRQTVSLFGASSTSVLSSYGGVGTSAKWSPDSQTVYITTNTNALLVHSNFTNWQAVTTGELYTDVAVTVPSVGAYFAGALTDGRSYCTSSVITAAGNPPTVTDTFYPLADEKTTPTDRVAATNSGTHILGAHAAGAASTLSDINVALPPSVNPQTATSGSCPAVVANGYFPSTFTTQPLAGVNATAINSIVPAANSALAFVTYTGTSGKLPVYVPPTTGPGALTFLTLGNGATTASAPVSGVFSTDGLSFYAGTSSDDQVHIFTVNGTSATETSVLTPKLPLAPGVADLGINLLVQKPLKTRN
jgi:hypothetical protein